MGVIVIGGQASGAGKTSLICALIAAMPERRWTAIKITQCSHGLGSARSGARHKTCDCELNGSSFAITEERDRTTRADSSRYLAAGAARSLWVRTVPGHLGEGISRVEEEIARAENAVIESNSILEFLAPDIYALIVSPEVADFKPSALHYLDRADAVLMVVPPEAKSAAAKRPDALRDRLSRIPQFSMGCAQSAPPEFVAFVRSRLKTLP